MKTFNDYLEAAQKRCKICHGKGTILETNPKKWTGKEMLYPKCNKPELNPKESKKQKIVDQFASKEEKDSPQGWK